MIGKRANDSKQHRGGTPNKPSLWPGRIVAVLLLFAGVGAGGDPPANADEPVEPLISLTGHTGVVLCIAFSPDGRFAVSQGGLGDSAFHLWDISKRRQLSKVLNEDCEGAATLWTADGRLVLSGGDAGRGGGAVLLQDPRTGKRVGNLITHDRPVRSVALSPDGKLMASADGLGIVRIWDFKTGAKLHSFEHSTGVNSVAFSPDGRSLLSGCDDKLVRLWDIEKDRQERLFEGHTATVGCVAFSADGRQAFSASYSPLGDSDGTIRLWGVATGKELAKLEVGDDVHRMDCAAFSPDRRRALTGHLDGSVCLWDLAAKKKLASFSKHKFKVQSVAFSPDGQLALSGENNQGGSDIWLYRLPKP